MPVPDIGGFACVDESVFGVSLNGFEESESDAGLLVGPVDE